MLPLNIQECEFEFYLSVEMHFEFEFDKKNLYSDLNFFIII